MTRPLLFVDHVDELEELGRVLNLVLAFGEYLPQNTLWPATARGARSCNATSSSAPRFCGEAFPVVFFGNGQFPVVWRLAEFIRHFQKKQIGELFQIIAIADAVIPQGIAEGPDLADDA